MTITVSIIIIGKDEAPTLSGSIRSARRALDEAGVAGEVLYADSGSKDGSAQIACNLGIQVVSIARDTANAARARNAGLDRARGVWVHFLDGDMELLPGWLPAALDAAQAGSLDGVGGTVVEAMDEASIWSRAFGHDWAARGPRTGEIGGAGLWRRATLSVVRGFDESLDVGEDPDLCRRMADRGYRIERLDHPMATHRLGLESFGAWWRRAVAVGRSTMIIGQRHRDIGLLLRRFLLPILGLALLAYPGLWPVTPLLALLWYARRVWLDRGEGLPVGDAFLHSIHVYAVRAPQLVGGISALAKAVRS